MMRNLTAYFFSLIALLNVTNSSANELNTGHVVGREIFGLAYDTNSEPLMIGERPLIFDTSAFETMIASGDKKFLISGFGDDIGGLYLSRYDDKSKQYIDTKSLDLSAIEGLSHPRGGVTTSWNSMLLAESKLVNAADADGFTDAFKPYYKGRADNVNPYNYGWAAEAILLDDKGSAKIIKHYSVGRVFASRVFIMPDAKSIYLLDSENAGQLYLYVAKDSGSLSAGALYGVRLHDGKVVYEPLGETSSLKMKFKLKKVSFDKIFETSPVIKEGCATGFTRVNTTYGNECLKVKKKYRKYAGLFEPIRVLAIKSKRQTHTKINNIDFSADSSRIELTSDSGQGMRYSLGPDEKIGSNYVIQELIR